MYSPLICWFSLGVFGAHFVLLGATLGFLLGALGSQGAFLGVTLASLGTPWGHLGRLGLPRGAWDDFGSKMDPNSEQTNSEQMAFK